MSRTDGRRSDQIRSIKIKRNYLKNALGSCLFECGDTRMVCSVIMEPKVPMFLRGRGQGWLTAEYGMIPASCSERIQREAARGKVGGRTQEIQRLIGRSLRGVVDLVLLGERTLRVDADVIQGDGGTRTAAITGSFIALGDAVQTLLKNGIIADNPIKDFVAAVSVGIVDGEALLDLCYEEDSKAEVDMNVVTTGSGKIIEIQGTAEGNPFTKRDMDKLLRVAQGGIKQLVGIQKKHLKFLG